MRREASERRALAVPAFRLFLTARAISWAGNTVTLVAMPILVYQLTGSPALTGLLTAIEALPYLAFGLPAGALADRWNRRRVLVVTGLASGLVMATVPAAAALDTLTVPHLFLAALAVSSLFVFFDAAGFGALPEIVGRDRIPSATGTMVSVSTVIGLAGPAAGGALTAAIGATWTIALDAAAYVIAALLTARVRWRPDVSPSAGRALTAGGLLRDIGEGLRYLWDTRIIRWLTLIGTGASVSGGAMLGLTIVVGVRQLGLADDDPRLGLLYTATAVGAFAMSLAIARIQHAVPTGWITLVSLTVSLAAQLAWAATTSVTAGLIVLAVFQAAATLTIVNGIVVRQSLAPSHLQSRVNTTARMIAWGGTPVGALLGGLLAERLSTATAILICSAGTGLGLTLGLCVRLWRVPRLAVLREAAH